MESVDLQEHVARSADRAADEVMRVALGTVRRLPASFAPTGFAAIAHRDLIAADLDPSVVVNWVHGVQGFESVTYLRPLEHALWHSTDRPPLQPVPYVAIPLDALDHAAATAA
jgi:hypothetical protein